MEACGGSHSSSSSCQKGASTGFVFEDRPIESPNGPVHYTWSPSWFQYRPILGLLSLAIAIGCMMASFAVLVISNGKPVDTAFWNVQPTVYLAIAASLGAFAVRFAMSQAVPVAWWYRALNGQSIRQLQYQWEAGQGPLSAITRLFSAPWMSVPSLLLLLMLVDGAFLQRASSIISATQTNTASLSFKLSPELPRGFSGSESDLELAASPMAKAAFSDWLANTSIPLEVQGCGPTSTCRAKVHAPGLATHNCTNIIQPISRAMLFSPNSTWGNYHLIRKQSTYLGNGASAGNGTVAVNPAFEVQLNTVLSAEQDIGPEMISVSTGFLRFDLKYGGNFTARRCYYQPAILEYDGQFQDGNLLLPADTSSSRVVAIVNNTRRFDYDSNKAQSQTLVYFYTVYAAYSQVNATVVFQEPAYAGQPWSFDPLTLNAYAMQFLGQHDGVWFEDAMPNIVSSFNDMMVRGSVAFSQSPQSNTSDLLDADVSLQQLVIGTKVTTLNVFRTEFGWFVAAAVIYAIVILAILPLFWGFWLFPRNVTLSPFEVSLAFRSPLFAGIHSTAGVNGIIENLGDVRIAYGVVEDLPASPRDAGYVTRLAIAGQEHTRMPMRNAEILA